MVINHLHPLGWSSKQGSLIIDILRPFSSGHPKCDLCGRLIIPLPPSRSADPGANQKSQTSPEIEISKNRQYFKDQYQPGKQICSRLWRILNGMALGQCLRQCISTRKEACTRSRKRVCIGECFLEYRPPLCTCIHWSQQRPRKAKSIAARDQPFPRVMWKNPNCHGLQQMSSDQLTLVICCIWGMMSYSVKLGIMLSHEIRIPINQSGFNGMS